MDKSGLYSKGDKIEPVGKITGSQSNVYSHEVLIWIKGSVICSRDW